MRDKSDCRVFKVEKFEDNYTYFFIVDLWCVLTKDRKKSQHKKQALSLFFSGCVQSIFL